MKYSVILLAAGIGSRLNVGYNKIWLTVHEQPVLWYSFSVFLKDPNCHHLILVHHPQEANRMRAWLHTLDLSEQEFNKVQLTSGGSNRQESVYLGLCHVTSDYVLVHDAARPCIQYLFIQHVLEALKKHQVVSLGVAVKDTIKRIDHNHQSTETLPREELVSIQTPQGFETNVLKKAHMLAEKEGFIGTDDASLTEYFFQIPTYIIPGSYDNIKLTTPEDIIHLQFMLNPKMKRYDH